MVFHLFFGEMCVICTERGGDVNFGCCKAKFHADCLFEYLNHGWRLYYFASVKCPHCRCANMVASIVTLRRIGSLLSKDAMVAHLLARGAEAEPDVLAELYNRSLYIEASWYRWCQREHALVKRYVCLYDACAKTREFYDARAAIREYAVEFGWKEGNALALFY